ncbi:ABC transporter substrate-binding protein [Salipaludibacillus keqinensis]|uniref:ABC transporter substrate-binding protein n=1 Tax=Salipaludibacillus keqinensis TaxID=2045207 RepID=A0A323TDB2_9BACI|nr:extracellular solute-binding protein [Salipaludibacillus keqinensis]PYZ92626.1 ABC transporter substrate-binding protein [Salipaludibacillus keqinensis]
MKFNVGSSLGLLTGVVLLLTACAGNQESGGSSSNGDNEDQTQISFIHWRGEDAEVFNEIIEEFEEENPNITVEMNIYPSEQYQSNAQQMLRDGSVGDVFTSFPGSQFEVIQNAGFFEDLTGESFVDNFNAEAIEIGQKDGQQLALPYQMVFNMPVYNVGMFEDLGLEPPNSWSEFKEMADTLLENDITPIAFPGADIGPNQFMNSMMMNNAPDEDIFEKLENGEESLTNEWWVSTLENFHELLDHGYISEDSLGTQQDAAISQVAQGEAAMLATGSYHMASLLEQNEDLELDFLAPITVEEDEAIYEGIHTATFMLGVNANSEKQEEAKQFIEFLSRDDIASKYANETGQHLTIEDVDYTSDALQNTAYWLTDKETRFQPRFFITNSSVENAVLSSIERVLGGDDPMEAAETSQQVVEENID